MPTRAARGILEVLSLPLGVAAHSQSQVGALLLGGKTRAELRAASEQESAPVRPDARRMSVVRQPRTDEESPSAESGPADELTQAAG